jgi:hypothetical protein
MLIRLEGYYGQPQPVYIQQQAPRDSAADDICCGMYDPFCYCALLMVQLLMVDVRRLHVVVV